MFIKCKKRRKKNYVVRTLSSAVLSTTANPPSLSLLPALRFSPEGQREMEEEKATIHFSLLSSPSSSHAIARRLWGCGEGGEFMEEVRKQLLLAGPLVAANLLQRCIQLISVMFVGHLGELALSGASMATSFITVTGFSLLLGLATALDTLCGQANGAKQYSMLGVYMQRSIFLAFLVSIPLALLWTSAEKILLAVGQDPEISSEAGIYARWMIPALLAYGILQSEARFLQSQNSVWPMVLSSGLCALLHPFICWSLIFKIGLGYRGAALATSISYCIDVLILALFIKCSPSYGKTWTGFSWRAVHDVGSFLKIALPSAAMICFAWWSFNLLTFLAGLLPNPKVETSVLAAILNTGTMAFMVPNGLSAAVSTRVANELGAGRPQAARLAVYVVLLLVAIEASIMGIAILFIRDVWGFAFSNNEEVVAYISRIMPFLAICTFMDAIQCVLAGVARGCGQQKYGALINLGAYYIVGIPVSVVLAFAFHAGVKGLWLGVTSATFLQMVSLLCLAIFTNWEKEIKKAMDRVCASTAM